MSQSLDRIGYKGKDSAYLIKGSLAVLFSLGPKEERDHRDGMGRVSGGSGPDNMGWDGVSN